MINREQEKILIEKIKEDLIQRFKKSTSMDGSFVITMKVDNVMLIITPDWTFGQLKSLELANLFTVYVDVPKGRAAVPHLSSDSLTELARKLLYYKGIDLKEGSSQIRMMKLADDYEWSYDMYEESIQNRIMAMHNPKLRRFVHAYDEELDEYAFM